MVIVPGCLRGHLTRTEYTSTSAKVKPQGITKPMIVTKKLQKKKHKQEALKLYYRMVSELEEAEEYTWNEHWNGLLYW